MVRIPLLCCTYMLDLHVDIYYDNAGIIYLSLADTQAFHCYVIAVVLERATKNWPTFFYERWFRSFFLTVFLSYRIVLSKVVHIYCCKLVNYRKDVIIGWFDFVWFSNRSMLWGYECQRVLNEQLFLFDDLKMCIFLWKVWRISKTCK